MGRVSEDGSAREDQWLIEMTERREKELADGAMERRTASETPPTLLNTTTL
jgi:hypothetical protein